jgi:hypothetical protein
MSPRDTTYFAKFKEWRIEIGSQEGSYLEGSSQYATPWSQPDTPLQAATPFENFTVPGTNDDFPRPLETAYKFQPFSSAQHDEMATNQPEGSVAPYFIISSQQHFKDASSTDSSNLTDPFARPVLSSHQQRPTTVPRRQSLNSENSDLESHASNHSNTSTIVSELCEAIDEEMNKWEPTQIIFHQHENVEELNRDAAQLDKDDLMSDDLEQNYNAEPRRFHDSGYDAGNLDSLAEAIASEEKLAEAVQLTSDNSRSRILRPKPIPGGLSPLVDVALQAVLREGQNHAKLFSKSADNLRIISKLESIQAKEESVLHRLAASIYDQHHEETLQMLKSHLSRLSKFDMVDEAGNTAGHIALSNPLFLHRPEVTTLRWITTWIDHEENLLDSRNNSGETLLHCAAKHGYQLVILELLRRGASSDAQDNNGQTALQVCQSALHASSALKAARAQSIFCTPFTVNELTFVIESTRLYNCAEILRLGSRS